jgi:hypothetical protein
MSQFAGTFPDMVSHLVLVDNFGPVCCSLVL